MSTSSITRSYTPARPTWSTRLAAPGRGLWLFGLAIVEVLVACLLAFAYCLLIIAAGVFVTPSAIRLLRRVADVARRRAGEWGGIEIAPPYLDEPASEPGFVGRVRQVWALLTDRATWRDILWSVLDPLTGVWLAALPGLLIVYGAFGVFVQPFVWRPIDRSGGSNWYTAIHVDSAGTALAGIPVGLVLIALGLAIGPRMLQLHARWTRVLLGPSSATELQKRVVRLTGTRTDATDAQAAELRRIERDLHDGAQARLVAMGMNLGKAEELLDDDPEAARTLLLSARDASSKALEELRDLVRGIHPPVLADRGIADAVRALALDAPFDVDVVADVPSRPVASIESAMYFAISEILTNTVKHSHATRADIVIGYRPGRLSATVTDDGRGGAKSAAGTGLRGVERRLATFDGTIDIVSPTGGPTTVTLEIPCVLSSQKTSSS